MRTRAVRGLCATIQGMGTPVAFRHFTTFPVIRPRLATIPPVAGGEPGPFTLGSAYGPEPVGPQPGPTSGEDQGEINAAIAVLEDPKLIGTVIRQSSYAWVAFRAIRWGGTSLVCKTWDEARRFIEAACGNTILRREDFLMPDGTEAVRLWNQGAI